MTKHKPNPKVDWCFTKARQWRDEMEKLRIIALGCGLNEDLKWGKPCYAFEGGNVVVIQSFKAYCALLFFKGYMLKDAHSLLVKTGENTRVGRQARFTSVHQIAEKQAALKDCIREAIDLEKSGVKAPVEESPEPKIPDELQNKMDENPAFKMAFRGLTPGRQRAYIYYFSGAKQSKTREDRIEKCTPKILAGMGFLDKPKPAKRS